MGTRTVSSKPGESAYGMCVVWILLTIIISGCASTRCAPGRTQVSAELQIRTSNSLGPAACGEPSLPDDVSFDDGLTADEAVAVSLWNNSAFNSTLTQLGIARGDLVQAGLLRNPQFQIFLPGGTKQLEWALFLPVDAFLLRETRLDMSQQEVCRVAEQLVQNGLDVVRDTRVAHADLVFAVDRAALAKEAVSVRKRVADLTKKQLDAGDISELEATTARIDFLRAQADAAGLQHAVAQAEARLKQLMSIGEWQTSVQPIAIAPNTTVSHLELQSLIAEATMSRPDLRAASMALEAAKKRAELSRWQWLRFDVVADANSGGAGNSNFGPGFRFDIPFFDRNQGGIISADWSVNQATQNYNAVRDQVVMDVQSAYSQIHQAAVNLILLRTDVLSSLEEAVQLSTKAYADGGAAYFLVLQTTGQFLDARNQELQLVADLQRANANLDRAVGHKVIGPQIEVPEAAVEEVNLELSALSPEPVGEMLTAARNTKLSEPGASHDILNISGDQLSLFAGKSTNKQLGTKLRRIADQLDTMNPDSGSSNKGQTQLVDLGDEFSAEWKID